MKKFIITVVLIGGLFAFYQFSNPSLIGDDDVYWHIRYSENIFNTGHLTAKFFGDPIPYAGVLFHIVLAPFTLFPNIFIAQKVAGLFFVLLISGLFYSILKKIGVKYAPFLTLVLFLLSVNFSFRLLLVRTFLISITLLLVGTYCLLSKKHWLLFLCAVAFALSYSIPFLLIFSFAWVFSQFISSTRKEIEWHVPLVVLLGLVIGLALHPVFPENVYFLKDYLLPVFYKIPIQDLNGGVELKSFSFFEFISYEWMILVVWVSSLLVFLTSYLRAEERTEKLFFALIACMFFTMSIISRRFIEYWALFAGLSAFYIFKPYLLLISFEKLKNQIIKIHELKIATFVFVSILALGCFHNFLTVNSWAKQGAQINVYENVGKWLAVNIPEKAVVLNTDWTLYPKLYFYNSSAIYIAQFDPAYLYVKNRDIYDKWLILANDETSQLGNAKQLYEMISQDFHAQYLIFLTQNSVNLKQFIENNDSDQFLFKKEYQDDTLTIYKLKG